MLKLSLMVIGVSAALALFAGCHDTLSRTTRVSPQIEAGPQASESDAEPARTDATATILPDKRDGDSGPHDSGSALEIGHPAPPPTSPTAVPAFGGDASADAGPAFGGDASADAGPEFEPLFFTKRHELPSKKASDITSFEVDGVVHLVVANHYDDSRATFLSDTTVYAWDGDAFNEVQSIET
ncbi:MAG: hypothetical protein RJA70_1190, partial [Pseudomonadota bacterium]